MTLTSKSMRCFGLVGLGLVLPTFDQDAARNLLLRVLKSQRSVNYLHIETRSFDSGSATAQVKVQTVAGRGVMVTILKPSYQSGIVTIDDSKESKTFLPDQNRLVVQPSPFQLQPSIDLRWTLIKKNYDVKFGRNERIADNAVREIVLVPMEQEMPLRRMFVEPSRAVVLRYTVETTETGPKTIFDTQYVEFGRDVAETEFGLPEDASEASIIRLPGPKKLKIPSDSAKEMGFTVRLPDKLPFGFKSTGIFLFGKGKSKYVGVKITDGLSSLTVYQWKKGRFEIPPDAKNITTDRYGVSLGMGVIPGDAVPQSIIEQLLEVFREND